MQYKQQVYFDPTGGGDDIFVIAPLWAELPSSLEIWINPEDGDSEELDFHISPEDLIEVDRPDDTD